VKNFSWRTHLFARKIGSKIGEDLFLESVLFWPELSQNCQFLDEKYHLVIFCQIYSNIFLNLVNFKILEWYTWLEASVSSQWSCMVKHRFRNRDRAVTKNILWWAKYFYGKGKRKFERRAKYTKYNKINNNTENVKEHDCCYKGLPPYLVVVLNRDNTNINHEIRFP